MPCRSKARPPCRWQALWDGGSGRKCEIIVGAAPAAIWPEDGTKSTHQEASACGGSIRCANGEEKQQGGKAATLMQSAVASSFRLRWHAGPMVLTRESTPL